MASKALVIVESPAKVKTINKILGTKFKVTSSMRHLIDLPKSSLGVDVQKEFLPQLIVVRDKQKILTALKKEAATKTDIYIATDPDREGEAIGWNLANHLGADKKYFRVTFYEITKEAVLKAFKNPREFDRKLIDAQIARRVLDRIVGYEISPLLWKKVGSRLSAGRVQSVALRLIVDREREISKFIPQEYWQIAADFKKKGLEQLLPANLEKIDQKKIEISSAKDAENISSEIKKESFAVTKTTKKEIRRNAPPPFITSTLQQEAFSKLGFNTTKTMLIAQQLYEGMEIGDGEPVGLITYMRTDSVHIADEAIDKVRKFIVSEYGKEYLPSEPNRYKSKKSAQEAHECIRATDVSRRPQDLKSYLNEDQMALYDLIWKRFVSCQMTQALFQNIRLEIIGGKFQFGATGSTLLFNGYLVLYRDVEEDQSTKVDLGQFAEQDALSLEEIKPSQHFTKPPPRFSEASLVKALEEDGIGRPSTYASIIRTLVERNYVARDRGYFKATDLGMRICDLLIEYFAKIMDIGFTAKMEESLDLIEEGELDYAQLLKDFYGPFKEEMDYATANMVKTQMLIDKQCPQCQSSMAIKWGRRGRFLSCSGFPKCKYSEPYPTGIKCLEPGCGGELVERRSQRGSTFFGCSRFPDCKYITNKLPQPQGPGDGTEAQAPGV